MGESTRDTTQDADVGSGGERPDPTLVDGAGDAEMFGPYELRELVGVGGMGEVWRAHDHRQGRDVALKRITAAAASDDEFRARFLREARLTAALDSLHVIPVYDFGEIDGRLYLVMRLVSGGDLDTTLAAFPDGLAPQRAITIVEQVADALDAAHARELVHRDVKPANVLLGASRGQDFAYLVDFGIAKAADDTGLTSTGTTIGTAAYLAPELYLGHEATPAADVYALGCVLHECLTGRRAFAEQALPAVMRAHLDGPVPRTARPDLAGYDQVLARALAKNPADRHPSAGDLAAHARSVRTPAPEPPGYGRAPAHVSPWALPAAPTTPAPRAVHSPAHGFAAPGHAASPPGFGQDGPPPPASPAPPPPSARRRWWPWVIAAAVLVLAVAGGVTAALARGGETPAPEAQGPVPGPAVVQPPPRASQIAARPLLTTVNNGDGIAVSPDGTRAWVAATGSVDIQSRDVLAIDLPTGAEIARIPVGLQPIGVILSPDGLVLYVTTESDDATGGGVLTAVDSASGAVLWTVPTGVLTLYGSISPDGRYVYLADAGFTDQPGNAVVVVDTVTRSVTRAVPVGVGPWDVAVTPDGRTAYASNLGTDEVGGRSVSAIDTATATVRSTITTGYFPAGLALSPDGRTLYAAESGSDQEPLGAVTVIDTGSDTVRTVIRGSRFAPIDVAVSPDGSRAVAVSPGSDQDGFPSGAAVIDTVRNTIIADIEVGRGAYGVAFAPDGRQAYVSTDTGVWVVDVP